MLKRVERIKGDLGGLDVGVVSVNDKTGKVELTAEDVGALPSDTHIPADQVQSNWTETDTTKPDYIKNKPTVPTKTSQLTNDSDFVTSSGRVANATYADTFRTAYISHITPAQAAAMVSDNTSWPLAYNKNYLQTVSVGWDDYQNHNFPAGASGMFFPGYGSNGGTLVLVNYPANRMLYNVWIDSNRWSGWHYIDLSPVTYS